MEADLLLWIHGRAAAPFDAVFRLSHVTGGMIGSSSLVVLLAAWHLFRGERREALAWLVVGLSTLVLLEALKPVVARARPALWPRIVSEAGYSFPSGHALASATFYPILAWEASRFRPALTRLWYALAIVSALWVGLGRLYLGVHWPSDVAAGWGLGALQSALALRVLRRD